MLNPAFSFLFHLLETVLFHPEILVYFFLFHILPYLILPSQTITSDQYPLPRYIFSLLRHSSLCFNLLHLVRFPATHLFNRSMESTDISYFLHLLYSEQLHAGRTWVTSGTAPHWSDVMRHWASCYHLVLSFLFQLAQAEQHPSRLETKDKASSKISVIGPGLLRD